MPPANRDDDDDDRPRRPRKPLKSKAVEDDEDDEPVRPSRRNNDDDRPRPAKKPLKAVVVEDDEDESAEEAEPDADEERPVRKKKKKKKQPKPLPGQTFIKYAIWGGIGFGVVMAGLIVYALFSWLYVPAAATINGVDWYKAPETLGRYDMLFPGGRPSHDLITLRNPQTDVRVRAELWQRKYKGRMYEACYISGDNVTAANINGAANNMKDSKPPNDWGKSWVSKIVLNDGARCIVMRVYGPDPLDENDPLVATFFENFKLPN